MKGADIEREFAAAVANVRQPHLDRLREIGASPASIAHIGSAHPPFGILNGTGERNGSFVPGDGLPHVVVPVVENGGLIDYVAWRSGNPARWWLRSGLGWLLNADGALSRLWPGDALILHSTPLGWLSAFGVGGVVVDWQSPDISWLRGVERIECSDDMLAATIRRTLDRPRRLPQITGTGVRRAA